MFDRIQQTNLSHENSGSSFGIHPFDQIGETTTGMARSESPPEMQLTATGSQKEDESQEPLSEIPAESVEAISIHTADGAGSGGEGDEEGEGVQDGLEPDTQKEGDANGDQKPVAQLEGDMTPCPVPEGEPEPPLEIEHKTKFKAPDGSPNDRTQIGVGEVVKFKGSEKGQWTASSGTPVNKAQGKRFRWKAPNRGGTAEISLTVGKRTQKVQFTVVEPANITSRLIEEKAIPAGVIGAGMFLKFRLNPLYVSFGSVESKEVSGPPSGEWGLFAGGGGSYHESGDNFFPYWRTNWHNAQDEASMQFDPKVKPPLAPGGYKWIIPNHFRVIDEAGDGKHFTDVTQEFKVDADGTVTINKAGQSVSRTV